MVSLCTFFILAPVTKKTGASSIGKSGTGFTGKSSSNSFGKGGNSIGKSTSLGKTPNIGKVPSNVTTPKLTGFTSSNISTSSNKNYSLVGQSNSKPSVSLGIVWIPSKKHKKKDIVYNHQNYEYGKERSPSMYKFMSGDSNEYDFQKKKDEDSHLLVPSLVSEKSKSPLAAIATAEVATATVDLPSANIGDSSTEEKQELMRQDSDDTKEVAGDINEKDDKYSDYLENNSDEENKSSENKWEKDKLSDKVDSVYLRPPPPNKARSTASTPEEEDCGVKCLYYTLQCCDCVLM